MKLAALVHWSPRPSSAGRGKEAGPSLNRAGRKTKMELSADSSLGAAKDPFSVSSCATNRLWRLSNFVMAVFFGLAGAVQVNDPDPGLWIIAYAVPAALTLVVSLNPPIADNAVWRSLSDVHSAACVAGSAILGYSLLRNAQKNILHEEEGRELFGLMIVTVWMSLCRSSAKNTLGGIRLAIAVILSLSPFIMWLYIYVNSEMRASWPSHCKTVI